VVKPAPVIDAALRVTGDVPDDVSVTDRVVEVFTVTLPKLRVEALTVNCAFAVIPVPLNATTAVLPLVELLLIVSCPVAVPVVVGTNCTCRVTDWLGLSVTGKLPATKEKADPAIEAEFTVTAELPEELSVSEPFAEEFTVTLPKLRVEALSVNIGVAAAIPVPVRATATVLPLAELLLILSCPEAAPAALGRNCSCRVTDWFGLNVIGKLFAAREKPAPVIEAEFTVTAELPDEVSVSEAVAAEFTVTLPKLRAEALNVNCDCRCRPGFATAMLTDDPKARPQASARRRSLPRLRNRCIPASNEHEPIISGV
jgi:hypothetical protein